MGGAEEGKKKITMWDPRNQFIFQPTQEKHGHIHNLRQCRFAGPNLVAEFGEKSRWRENCWDECPDGAKGVLEYQTVHLVLIARDELDGERSTQGLAVDHNFGILRVVALEYILEGYLCVDVETFLARASRR